MRLKKDSLLDKILKEYKIYQEVDNEDKRLKRLVKEKEIAREEEKKKILSVTEKFLEDIEESLLLPNTELTRRIEEIINLQKKNDYDSVNQITTLLQDKFDYNYPFHYTIKGNNSIEKTNLILENNLINHIRKEVELNKIEPSFHRAKSYIENRNKLNSEKSSLIIDNISVWSILSSTIAYSFIIFIAIFLLINTSYFKPKITNIFFVFLIIILLGIIANSFIRINKRNAKKRDINRVDKLLVIENSLLLKELNALKTKANNVYNS